MSVNASQANSINRAGNRLAEIFARKKQRKENQSWLVVYLDVITLLLAMFILLINEPQDLSSPQQSKVASQSVTQQTPVATEVPQESTTNEVSAIDLKTESTAVQSGINDIPTEEIPQQQTLPEAVIAEMNATFTKTPDNESEQILMAVDTETPTQSQPATPASTDEKQHNPVDSELENQAPVSAQVPDQAGPSQIMLDQLKALDAEQMRIEVSSGQINLHLPEAILFETGQSDLLADANELLEKIAPILAQTEFPVSVEGHTDDVPIRSTQFPSNWELSSARATVVIRKLIDTGIDFKRLKAIGLADTQPIADNQTEQGRQKNRRVNIIIHADSR